LVSLRCLAGEWTSKVLMIGVAEVRLLVEVAVVVPLPLPAEAVGIALVALEFPTYLIGPALHLRRLLQLCHVHLRCIAEILCHRHSIQRMVAVAPTMHRVCPQLDLHHH